MFLCFGLAKVEASITDWFVNVRLVSVLLYSQASLQLSATQSFESLPVGGVTTDDSTTGAGTHPSALQPGHLTASTSGAHLSSATPPTVLPPSSLANLETALSCTLGTTAHCSLSSTAAQTPLLRPMATGLGGGVGGGGATFQIGTPASEEDLSEEDIGLEEEEEDDTMIDGPHALGVMRRGGGEEGENGQVRVTV